MLRETISGKIMDTECCTVLKVNRVIVTMIKTEITTVLTCGKLKSKIQTEHKKQGGIVHV